MITFRVVALSGKEPPCRGAFQEEISVVGTDGKPRTERVWCIVLGTTPDTLDGYPVREEWPSTSEGNFWLVIED